MDRRKVNEVVSADPRKAVRSGTAVDRRRAKVERKLSAEDHRRVSAEDRKARVERKVSAVHRPKVSAVGHPKVNVEDRHKDAAARPVGEGRHLEGARLVRAVDHLVALAPTVTVVVVVVGAAEAERS